MTIDVRDKLLDAHIHVHSPDFTKYPLAPGFDRSDLWYPSMTPHDYAGYARGFGTVRANLVQPTWYGLDHTYIIDCIASAPGQYVGTGIVSAVSDVALPPPDRTMLRLSERGIRAFRIRGGSARARFGGKTNWLDYPGYDAMFETAANHGLALSFLIGPDDLPEIDRMCSRYPDTRVVIDHVAGIRVRDGRFPADHVEALCRLARHRNLTVKLGPFHVLGDQPLPFLDLLPLLQPRHRRLRPPPLHVGDRRRRPRPDVPPRRGLRRDGRVDPRPRRFSQRRGQGVDFVWNGGEGVVWGIIFLITQFNTFRTLWLAPVGGGDNRTCAH